MNSVFNVIIMGAGKMGAFYDSPDSEQVLTHGHAFSKSPNFNVLGFVDTDLKQAQKAADTWGGKAFSSLESFFALDPRQRVDVVCLATPTPTHADLLRKIADYPVRLVFAEKPLVQSLDEAEPIAQLYQEKKIALALNYIRRFVPEFAELKTQIDAGVFGGFVSGVSYYGKGFLNNGSHHLDLIQYLLGDFRPVQVTEEIHDFWEKDPSLTVLLESKTRDKSRLILKAVDCRQYTLFEFDWLFEKGRIKMTHDGQLLECFTVKEHPQVSGYHSLVLSESIKTSVYQAMGYAVDNIFDYLEKGTPLNSTEGNGIKALGLYEESLRLQRANILKSPC